MDTNQLQTFIKVAETGSFTEASESLYLTQPAVSKRIHSLENRMKALLFDRIGNNVQLTEAGKILLPRAKQILLQLDECQLEIKNLSGKISGRLKLATSHHVALHRLPDILKVYTNTYPEVELDCHFLDSEAAYHSVINGDSELAIVTLSEEQYVSLKTTPIWSDPLHPYISIDHNLAAYNSISLDSLAQIPVILPNTKTFTRELLQTLFLKQKLNFTRVIAANYLETIRMLISIGLGWSLLPEIMANNKLRRLNIPQLTIARRLGLIQHVNRSLSNAGSALIDLLEEHKDL